MQTGFGLKIGGSFGGRQEPHPLRSNPDFDWMAESNNLYHDKAR